MADEEKVKVNYYDMRGNDLQFDISPRDLELVCNVLYNYCEILAEDIARSQNGIFKAKGRYYLQRIEGIRNNIETCIGYSTEEAIARCEKKMKRDDDIGGDAMEMAMRGTKR